MKIIEFELSRGVSLEMMKIPAGNFLMGSAESETEKRQNETPQHEVTLESFYLGKSPVTQRQWLAVMESLPNIAPRFRGDDFPVVNVWLEMAIAFHARLGALTEQQFRFPSEAEWEYACRAGTATLFSFGQKLSADLANFSDERIAGGQSDVELKKGLTPVGSFPPNAFGLHDMHGNVWEWCADIWHENYIGAPADGSAWTTNGDQSYCVQRGGSWIDRATNCRSAFRVGDIARNNDHIVGLRACLTKK